MCLFRDVILVFQKIQVLKILSYTRINVSKKFEFEVKSIFHYSNKFI